MRLSMNFTLAELTKSSTALRLGIDNTPDERQLENLTHLVKTILQPVRTNNGPVTVSSGLRVLALNRAVGSKDNSQHIKGNAADFEVVGQDNYTIAKWIEENLDFDQLILEFYTPGQPSSGWIHCSSVHHRSNRKIVTTAEYVDGITVYSMGLSK